MAQNRKARRRAAALARKERARAQMVLPGFLRAAALGTLAASALIFGYGRSARAQIVPPAAPCNNIAGATVTCTGNLQPGVAISQFGGGAPDTYDTLNINNVTQNIVPAYNQSGIYFSSDGPITVNSDTGAFSISTTGGGGNGIELYNADDISLNHTGDIVSANARGISAATQGGGITTNSQGTINASTFGIYAITAVAAETISITHSGNITSSAGIGVGAYSANLIVDITGDITAAGQGMRLRTFGGSVDATSVGNITSNTDIGIYAYSLVSTVTVDTTGNINAVQQGVFAQGDLFTEIISDGNVTSTNSVGLYGVSASDSVSVTSDGNVVGSIIGIIANGDINSTVNSTGNVTGQTNEGIYASAINGAVDVTSNGNVTGRTTGILASGDTSATVNSTGNVTSILSQGFNVYAGNGPVNVTSNGNVNANNAGFFAYSPNGSVTVTSTGNVTSTTDTGIYAQASTGTTVSVNSTGNITAAQYGILAYGNQVTNVTQTGNINADVGAIVRSFNSTVDLTSTGNITAVNNAVQVTSDQVATVTSVGNVSSTTGFGFYVRSLSSSATVQSTGNVSAAGIGISAYGNNGPVNVTSIGNVTSTGSTGISATSPNSSVEVESTGDITADGYGIFVDGNTAVQVTSTGNITVANNPAGIYARSTGGTVSVDSTGNIGGGNNNFGIRALGPGPVDVTTSGGTVSGVLYGLFPISITSSTTVTNKSGGTVTGDAAAIYAQSLTGTTITNESGGTIDGNVVIAGAAGNNLFDNQNGGLFNAGPNVDLNGDLLRNAGTFAPGAINNIETTALTGNINQTASGIFQVDVDATAGNADRVNVTGTANLNGSVLVQVLNPAFGQQSNTILSAAGGTTNNGLGLLASPALNASLSFPNATDVVLTTEIDFSTSSLNQNQTNVANNLNAILGSGVGTVGPVLTALLNGVTNLPDYLNALNQLIPEAYLNTETAALFAAEEFNANLLSCPKAGEGFTAVSQGQCMWVRYDGRWTDGDSTRQNIGYEEDSHGISGGGQVAVAPNWFIGIAGAYENGDLDADNNASADSDRYMLGGVIKYQSGPVLMALAGSLGTGEVDMTRRLNFGGFNATARSSFDVDHVGATFHAAYLADRGAWYAKPFIDVNVIHIDRDSAQETGAGAANQNISGSDETYFSVTPALELGTTIDQGDGRAIRPYVRAGVTFYGDTDQSLTARFAGAPAAAGGFTTTSEFDDIFADIEAGLTLFHGEHGTVSAGYEGRFSDDTQVHGFFVKGTRAF